MLPDLLRRLPDACRSAWRELPVVGPVGVLLCGTGLLVLALEFGIRKDDSPLATGSLAPDLSLPRLDQVADTLHVQELRGKVVLLEMWNTSCANCREAMPAAEALAREHAAEGLIVVHIANENMADSLQMRTFLVNSRLTGMVVVDDHRTFLSNYQIWAVPWSVLLDRDGRVVWQHPGVIAGVAHPLLALEGQAALAEALRN